MNYSRLLPALTLSLLLVACGGGGGGSSTTPTPVPTPTPTPTPTPPPTPTPSPTPLPGLLPQPWAGFGGDPQHSAQSTVASMPLTRILWQAPVDKAPDVRNGDLLIHYGSPVISRQNTLLLPVKTSTSGDFQVEARNGSDGTVLWRMSSDYVAPTSAWTPSFNIALTRDKRVIVPGAGGKLLVRNEPDSVDGSTQTLVFYGKAAYDAAPAAFNASIKINTPLTVDVYGTVYFGFIAAPGNPAGLKSGIARVMGDGSATVMAASDLAGDPAISKLAMNAAPTLSFNQDTLYIGVNTDAPANGGPQTGYLLALDSTTLALKGKVALTTPLNTPATVSDNSTASPMAGPDGDVYYGVLESSRPYHNSRGWLLHFNAALTVRKTPGSFGWDNTPSVVPAEMVPSYHGSSSYLLLSKYNNYFGAGTGDGQNRMAILDPNGTQADQFTTPIISVLPTQPTVMKEVITILGASPDPDAPGGLREWCVNTAAVDAQTKSIVMNSEDGILYRWDTTTNTFSERIRLDNGIGQAYTPTLIGPGGIVYSINNATLFAVGR